MKQSSCILFCNCSANVISQENKDQLAKALQQFDADVFELNDICAFAVHDKSVLKSLSGKYERKIVIACYSRAVKSMFLQQSVDMGEFEILNFKELSVTEIEEKLRAEFDKGEANYEVLKSDLKVPAWFPVIDQSRCTLCGQCARFCLFGVYSFNKKKLEVVNPLACKNNCPACGRTCPASAIMFPRLAENSVLAGAEPGEKKKYSQGSGLFVMLNERNQARKNIFKQGVIQQAEEERRKALEELKRSVQKED